jgi:hypothetical protein
MDAYEESEWRSSSGSRDHHRRQNCRLRKRNGASVSLAVMRILAIALVAFATFAYLLLDGNYFGVSAALARTAFHLMTR